MITMVRSLVVSAVAAVAMLGVAAPASATDLPPVWPTNPSLADVTMAHIGHVFQNNIAAWEAALAAAAPTS
ncbi:hypothetical protein D5S17_20120 [Pseudonocardiaceae bacterium YIM PH 21723]|nr:hypothetical protein D5S17_20120 [Pseudonocardiaceae bacterium YIM PH 21723]